MKHPLYDDVTLKSVDADKVAGGLDMSNMQVTCWPVELPPLKPVEPPVYYTLAIGEDGGNLPVITA